MGLFENVAGLEVNVESVSTETKEVQVSEEFPRKTTIVTLEGENAIGKGEDVIYDTFLHEYPSDLERDLKGRMGFDDFATQITEYDLFDEAHDYDQTQLNYRRWAVESAGLDLALKQHKMTLAQALGREYQPVRFVVSPSIGENTLKELQQLTNNVPGIEFKLDAKAEWDEGVVADLAALNRVRIVDFKSHYDGFGRDPDFELYKMVAEGFDDVLLEDPKLTADTCPAFDGHEHRIAWDKPITGVESIEELPFRPSYLNIKLSRFGTVEALLDTIEYCQNYGIHMYGGGQFELGVGRQHIQAMASLFYPGAPNDVAPRVYNSSNIPENPPQSPLHLKDPDSGLEWRYRR